LADWVLSGFTPAERKAVDAAAARAAEAAGYVAAQGIEAGMNQYNQNG
jgi:peptidyl-tRNA hydrolase